MLRKRRGITVIEFTLYTVVTVCFITIAVNLLKRIYYYTQPEVKVEIQLKECAEKIGFGNKYIVVELPVSDETEKLLKEEHYEVYKELKEEQKAVYKKIDK